MLILLQKPTFAWVYLGDDEETRTKIPFEGCTDVDDLVVTYFDRGGEKHVRVQVFLKLPNNFVKIDRRITIEELLQRTSIATPTIKLQLTQGTAPAGMIIFL